jgi:hypothetical protein
MTEREERVGPHRARCRSSSGNPPQPDGPAGSTDKKVETPAERLAPTIMEGAVAPYHTCCRQLQIADFRDHTRGSISQEGEAAGQRRTRWRPIDSCRPRRRW